MHPTAHRKCTDQTGHREDTSSFPNLFRIELYGDGS